jgi:glycosyltransferase involved in cell wall biosynthesis
MLSPTLPVEGQKRGGIERAAHTLAQGLAERGHQVSVFSHDAAPSGAAYDVRPLPWRSFVNTWAGRRLTMGYLGNVLALLPDYAAADVIIAHGDSLLLPLKGKPVLRVMHGSALREATHASSIGRAALQFGVFLQELVTAATTPGTVAVSETARRDNPFIRHVIPHGVDDRIFRAAPREKTTTPSIVFVGARTGRKRGRFLTDIFTRVIRPAVPAAQLLFVGPEGPAIDGVTYFTGVSDAQLATLYRSAWLYASPSSYEGFGLPYLEAMACGTAVVATPNPGSREVIGPEPNGGLVVDDGEFPAAVLELLQNGPAREARERAGVARASQFPFAAMIDRYEAILGDLCAVHARTASA